MHILLPETDNCPSWISSQILVHSLRHVWDCDECIIYIPSTKVLFLHRVNMKRKLTFKSTSIPKIMKCSNYVPAKVNTFVKSQNIWGSYSPSFVQYGNIKNRISTIFLNNLSYNNIHYTLIFIMLQIKLSRWWTLPFLICLRKYELSQRMTKPTKWHVCPAKTPISLLCTLWVTKDPSFLHVDSKDWSDWEDT